MASCCAFSCCLGLPVWFCGGRLASTAPGDGAPAAAAGAGAVAAGVVAAGVVAAGVVVAAPGAVVAGAPAAGAAPAAGVALGERTSTPLSMAESAPGWVMVTSFVPSVG